MKKWRGKASKQRTGVPPVNPFRRWLTYLLPFLALLTVLLNHWFAGRPDQGEWYVRTLFPMLSRPLVWLVSLVPFSLTELMVVIGLPLVLVMVIFWLIRLILRRDARKRRVYRGVNWLLQIAALGMILYQLMFGFCYTRQPAAQVLDLPSHERPVEELTETAVWLAQRAAEARARLPEDDQGVMRLPQSLSATLMQANAGFAAAAEDHPALSGFHTVRPKPVLLSHLWSYTKITGVYNPFFGESNVNIDQPAFGIPDTAAHEVAHLKGFAREDEAGFIAFLTGFYQDDPAFRYSAASLSWIRLSNRLADLDRSAYERACEPISEAMWRDFAAQHAYWKRFEGPVAEVSEQVNDAYLRLNRQSDGVQSYGRMIDLVLAWYAGEKDAGRLDVWKLPDA